MTKTTRKIEQEKNMNILVASVIIGIIVSLIFVFAVYHVLNDKIFQLEHKFGYNKSNESTFSGFSNVVYKANPESRYIVINSDYARPVPCPQKYVNVYTLAYCYEVLEEQSSGETK